MKNLKELKKKYEELGKEIERLEKEKSRKRWRADVGEYYFYVGTIGEVNEGVETTHFADEFRHKTRNYFKTEEEAQRHLDNINTYYELMDLAEELNEGEEIDWENLHQIKYSITYDTDDKKIFSTSNNVIKNLGRIYCLNKNFLEVAKQKIGEERLESLFKEE